MRKLHSQLPESVLYRAATEYRGLTRTTRVTSLFRSHKEPKVSSSGDIQELKGIQTALGAHLNHLIAHSRCGGAQSAKMKKNANDMFRVHDPELAPSKDADLAFVGTDGWVVVHKQVLTAILQRHLELFSGSSDSHKLDISRFKRMSIVNPIKGQRKWKAYIKGLGDIGKQGCTASLSGEKRNDIVQKIQECINLLDMVDYDAIKISPYNMRLIIRFHYSD